MDKPLVSVSVITYNQEKFLKETLDSILSQETSFKFEIVLGDDCSTDNTRQICLEYKNKYPELIRLRLPETNMGSMPNWIANIQACEGKYIAFCEGDDYWIDNKKLEKQVSEMEAKPDCSICSHGANILYDSHTEKNILDKTSLTINDLINEDWALMTASLLIRNDMLKIPDWYISIKNGDFGLQLLLALEGDIIYIPEIMSVYRQHPGGVSASLKPLNQAAWLSLLLYYFDKHTKGEYRRLLRARVKKMYKKQIGFAKEFHLRKAAFTLKFFQILSPIAPYMIRHLRK